MIDGPLQPGDIVRASVQEPRRYGVRMHTIRVGGTDPKTFCGRDVGRAGHTRANPRAASGFGLRFCRACERAGATGVREAQGRPQKLIPDSVASLIVSEEGVPWAPWRLPLAGAQRSGG